MKTQSELENEIRGILIAWKGKLSDSPLWLSTHKTFQIGYYYGVCGAREWNLNLDFLAEIENL